MIAFQPSFDWLSHKTSTCAGIEISFQFHAVNSHFSLFSLSSLPSPFLFNSIIEMTSHVNYQREIYSALQRPKYPVEPDAWEACARRAVPPENFTYVYGSSSQSLTNRANIAAF